MRYIFSCILFLSVTTLNAQSVRPNTPNLNLKIPTDLYYSRTPNQGKSIKFTIDVKLAAINLITTDNQNFQRLGKSSISRRAIGRTSALIAIPKLYQIRESDNGNTYSFGQDGGENNNDDATITIRYQNTAPSPTSNTNHKPLLFSVDDSEIHIVKNGRTDFKNTEHFLKILASRNFPATIEINRKSEQGNCIVAIFDSKNGKFLGSLNPKDPNNNAAKLSFTVDTDVYVMPIIRPKVTSNNGIDTIVFEVGDPKKNGSATSEEE